MLKFNQLYLMQLIKYFSKDVIKHHLMAWLWKKEKPNFFPPKHSHVTNKNMVKIFLQFCLCVCLFLCQKCYLGLYHWILAVSLCFFFKMKTDYVLLLWFPCFLTLICFNILIHLGKFYHSSISSLLFFTVFSTVSTVPCEPSNFIFTSAIVLFYLIFLSTQSAYTVLSHVVTLSLPWPHTTVLCSHW